MSSPASRSVCNAVVIPELLALILCYLDDKCVAKSATVSTQWAGVALDIVWRDVHDLRRLLSLLSPLVSVKQASTLAFPGFNHKFSRKKPVLDWARFDRYSRRVRKVHHDESKRRFIDHSVWAEILHTRPRLDILPKLQCLTWHAMHPDRQYWSILFMHPNVQRLSLQIHRSPTTSAYIHSVLEEATGVVELELKSEEAMRHIETDLLPLLQCFSLQRVEMPMYFLTSVILSQLSRCPDLRSINISKPVEQGVGDRVDVALFSPSLEEGAFPALHQLSFSAPILHATQFLKNTFSPKNISFLYVHVIAVDDPHLLRDFFSTVAHTCKLITELHVDFIIGPDAPIMYPPPPLTDRPTIDTFRPLLSCRHLTRFEFRWDYQMNLSQLDIEELASSWPTLEILLLNCQPIPEDIPPMLTLQALIPFAKHCPRLRELGLYLDAQYIPSPLEYPNPRSLPAFRLLQKLSVGASSIALVEPAALFLSQLCPLGCQIISGVRWPDAYGIALDQMGIMDQRRLKMTEWWVRWTDLAKVLPLAIKARMEEKCRMDALQKEMETLALHSQVEKDTIHRLQRELESLRSQSNHLA